MVAFFEAGEGDLLFQFLHGGEHAAGEDVALDVIRAFGIIVEIFVADGDDLQHRMAAGFEAVFEGAKIGGPVGLAHGFEHFDGGDAVIAAFDVAIIFETDFDFVGEACILNALCSVLVLCFGDCDACDFAANRAGGIFREPAPAAADFENVVFRFEIEAANHFFVFAFLCFFEIGDAVGEEGGGIGHAGVEPGFVECVADVVVAVDIFL